MSLKESADLRTSYTKQPARNDADALPAFPEGWYFVATRESILREKLIEKTWMGEEIVVWCDEVGRVCMADAVCPHLGSYLGPEVGGWPPQWELPTEPTTGQEWCELGFNILRFRGHPQETTENSVDLGHLRYVHGYDKVQPVGSVTVDGAYLKSCFDFKRVRRILGVKDLVYEPSAVTHVYGLGYSFRTGQTLARNQCHN